MNPKPFWILRHHGSSPIRSIHHAHSLLAIGDDGGIVSLVNLVTFRPRFKWIAHTDSILTVLIVASDQVVTHARDNTLKLWHLPPTPPSLGLAESSVEPELIREIGVNALNFARCSHHAGHIAVPHTLDAAYIDILDLHTGKRESEAIGRPDVKPTSRLAIVMSLHLMKDDVVVAGYEDGWVKKWRDGELMWSARCHSESVMSVAVCEKESFGVSVGADDRIARFDLESGTVDWTRTRTPGKASVAISPDGKTVAVGGWDGSLKVYSTSTLTELGSLSYHRDTVECLAFALANRGDQAEQDDSDDDADSGNGSTGTQLVLAAGGKDGKVSLWKYH
ncbi:WD40 repeat [Kalmanozyma brasiliensis GHG001]|uniref:ASTRA-associated protein 1 n=1 Tax=Kalmanozyma brasiliensis (strain GHG001) TaxID=1365824 RepID=V5ER24_KALBG|nr:WD40 repeat [Kalmanozyma brasiliensis GHG001]EST07555.1 WD40 repeat [Kalmanozyma brasiliensis GHG001]